MRRTAILLCTSALLAVLCARAQTLEEVVEKNIAARGGEARLRNLQAVRLTGTFTVGDIELSVVMEQKRPWMMRTELRGMGMRSVEVFDGRTGWKLDEFEGQKEPRQMTDKEAADARSGGDLAGPFLEWEKKGYAVQLVGLEESEDGPVFHLTVKEPDRPVDHYFLDAKTFLEKKVYAEGDETAGHLTDYREFEGTLWPTTMELRGPNGN